MKRKAKHLILATTAMLILGTGQINAGPVARTEKTCDLTVQVWGFKNNNGNTMVGLWGSEKSWLKNEETVANEKGPVQNLKSTIRFTGLACGSYAVAIYHDANDNGKQDKNWFGIPTEGYGFSGSGDYRFGAAKFPEAAVELKEGETEIKIKLNNVM